MQNYNFILKDSQFVKESNLWKFTKRGEEILVNYPTVVIQAESKKEAQEGLNLEEFKVIARDYVDRLNYAIADYKKRGKSIKEVSDGYHTFKELYDFRMVYNALLFNMWAEVDHYNYKEGIITNSGEYSDDIGMYDVHKSWKHNDGEWCFGEEKKWFIVSAMLPDGQITNHYKAEHWDLFKIPEIDKALFGFDGHTGKDVLDRMLKLIKR